MSGVLEVTVRRDLAEFQRIRSVIEGFGNANRLPASTLFRLKLALDELLSNLFRYGYRDRSADDCDIRLRLALGSTQLIIELRDDGCAFDPLQMPPPDLTLPVETRPIGGLGIHLVRSLIDQIQYRREGRYNYLTLRQRLPPPSPSP